jgi:hypothetical protein
MIMFHHPSNKDSYVYWLRRYVSALNFMPGSLFSEQKLDKLLNQLGAQP